MTGDLDTAVDPSGSRRRATRDTRVFQQAPSRGGGLSEMNFDQQGERVKSASLFFRLMSPPPISSMRWKAPWFIKHHNCPCPCPSVRSRLPVANCWECVCVCVLRTGQRGEGGV